MPDLTGNASTLRAGNYKPTGYLSVPKQTVVFSRAINQASFTYPILELTYDDAYSGAGAYTDVREGMTIRFYDGNTSTLKGIGRVAYGIASTTDIQINEVSNGTIDFANNDRFDVIDEYRPWDMLVSNDGAFDKDSREAYTNQLTLYEPVANGGGAWVGFVDEGETFATVTFDATTSYTIDPDSSGTLTYLWDVGDGTITVGTTTTSTITVTFPVDERHVILNVTDASNSVTASRAIFVRVHDDSDPPISVIIDGSITGNRAAGWSGSVIMPNSDDSDIATLPDGSPAYYFEKEDYNGTIQSFGSNAPTTDRNHIKLCGYLDTDTLNYDAEVNEVTFSIISPLRMLEKTGALPQILIREASPTTWQEASGLTVAIMFWYLWRYGASFQHDVLFQDAREFAQTRLTVQDDSSIVAQLRDIARSLNISIECDRLGRIIAVRDPNYMSDAERNARTVTYNFTTSDLMGWNPTRQHHLSTKAVRGEGVSAADAASGVFGLFSDAPGPAPSSGYQRETLPRQVCLESDPQTDLNNRTGHHGAKINSTYYDTSTGAISIVPKGVPVRVPDGYDVFDPAYFEFVTFTIAGGARGIDYSTAERWTIEQVSITYDPDLGTKDVALTVDHETRGVAGTTFTPTPTEDLGLSDYTPTSLDVQPPTVSAITASDQFFVTSANGTMAMIVKDSSHIFITTNWKDAIPTWTPKSISGSFAGTIQAFALDGAALDAAWIATQSSIFYVTDIFGTPTAGPAQLVYGVNVSPSSGQRITMRANIADTNVVTVSIGYNSNGARKGVWTSTTTDGSTWAAVAQIATGYESGSAGMVPGLEISPKDASIQYAGVLTSIGSVPPPTVALYRSTDTGASWSSIATPGNDSIPMIHSAYDATGEFYWYSVYDNITPSVALYRSDTGTGTNYVDGLTDSGGLVYGPFVDGSLYAAPTNRKRIAMAGVTNTISSPQNYRIFVSSTEGASWVESPNPDNTPWYRCYTDGVTVYAFGRTGQIGVGSFNAILAGGAITDKTGDSGTAGEVLGIIGGGE